MNLPRTLGELRGSDFSEERLRRRRVKDEMRENLICKLRRREALFPGIVGYDDTVVPQIVNAVLSRHNFILLGLRGQAKSRILRALTSLLDRALPYLEAARSTTILTLPSAAVAANCLRSAAMRRPSPISRPSTATWRSWPRRM